MNPIFSVSLNLGLPSVDGSYISLVWEVDASFGLGNEEGVALHDFTLR